MRQIFSVILSFTVAFVPILTAQTQGFRAIYQRSGAPPVVFSSTIVGSCKSEANATTTSIVISGSPTCGGWTTVTSGNLLLVHVKGTAVGMSNTGVACTWYPMFNTGAISNGASFNSNYWYCIAPSTGTMTITGTSGSSYLDVSAMEVSNNVGGWQAYPLDRSASNVQTASSTTCSTGTTATQNNANDFIYVSCDNWNANQTYGTVSGYNFMSSMSGVEYGVWHKSQTAASTDTFSTTILSDISTGAIVGFKAVNSNSCDEYSLWDFSGGTNGSAPTAATLASSLFGEPNESPQAFMNVTGTALTYSTSGHHALLSSAPNFCNGGAYTDSGSLGMKYDTTTGGLSTIIFHFNNYAGGTNDGASTPGNIANTVTSTMWFCTTLPQTATVNMDLFAIYSSGGHFTNVPFQGAGSGLSVLMEAGTGTAIPISTSTTCGPSSGTWYQLAIDWVRNGTSHFAVYDASGTQVGSTYTQTTPNEQAAQLVIGNNLANSPTTGFAVYFDKVKLCFQGTCTFPMME